MPIRLESIDELEPILPMNTSRFKKELHVNIALNNIKVVNNLLKNVSSDFLLSRDKLGLNTLEFTKKYGTKIMYHQIQEQVIKDKQGLISCFKNFKQNVY